MVRLFSWTCTENRGGWVDEADCTTEPPPCFGGYHNVVHVSPVQDPLPARKCVIEGFQVQRTKERRDRTTGRVQFPSLPGNSVYTFNPVQITRDPATGTDIRIPAGDPVQLTVTVRADGAVTVISPGEGYSLSSCSAD